MITILSDLRHAVRTAVRQPGITLVIILTLAVGIGANTGIFTYLLEMYWSQIRAPDPERLFFVETGTEQQPQGRASYPDTLDYRAALADLGELSPWKFYGAALVVEGGEGGDGTAIFNVGSAVSPPHFELFGARMPLGRDFLPEEHEPGGPAVAVIDHFFWRRHLDADPQVLGRTIRINGVAFTIIGVTPRGFENTGLPHAVYIPMARLDDVVPTPLLADLSDRRFISLLRLKQGVRPEQAEARLAVLAANLDRERPWPRQAERQIRLKAAAESHTEPQEGVMLAGAVGLLLLLACVNVANLLLARANRRRREVAVLAALGASPGRLATRLLTESLLLATIGGALGLALGRWITIVIEPFYFVFPVGLANLFEGNEWVRYDARVLVFTLLVTVVTGCMFGLAPILYALRTDLVSALKRGAAAAGPGRRFGARRLLVISQVALSIMLLLGAGLLLRSLHGLEQRELGFETEHQVLASLLATPPRGESPAAQRQTQRRLYELARQRLAAQPGVVAATLTRDVPGTGFVHQTRLVLPRRPDESSRVDRVTIGRDYFSTFEIGEVHGRRFDDGDDAEGVGAVIVNGAFARRFFPGVEPLGQEIELPDLEIDSAGDRLVVVGMAPDIHHGSRRDELAPLVYLPLSQHLGSPWLVAVARTAGPPQGAMRQVRETLATVHPDLVLTDIGTYDRQVALDLHRQRLQGTVAGLVSLFGLGLACLGIYSVMSCSVSARRRELGIRQALGTSARDLKRLVLGEAAQMIVAGILIGVAAALALARLMSSLLYGVAEYDPAAFVVLPLVLAAIGLVAAWLPAWRAGQVDPKVALQQE